MGEIFNELLRVQPAITPRHARPRRDTKCIFNCFMHKTTKAPSRGGIIKLINIMLGGH